MQKIDLHPKLIIYLSDRFGGVSKEPYDSLNLATHVGDNPLDVKRNREIFASYFDTKNLVFMNQVHGDRVVVAKNCDLLDADALLCVDKDLTLCVMVADCAPIILFDEKNLVSCVIHAGRAGAFLDIISKSISKMRLEFGTKDSELLAYIGPFIKSCCYEIKGEVLKQSRRDFPNALVRKDERYFLDLGAIINSQLLKNGVTKIKNSNICTSCDERDFSYRREGLCGRFALGVKIK